MDNTISTGLGTVTTDTYDYINNLLTNPTVIIILVIVVIIYIIIFMSLGQSSSYSSDEMVSNSGSACNVNHSRKRL